MAKISYTSIHDILILRKVKMHLYRVKERIDKFDNHISKNNLEEQVIHVIYWISYLKKIMQKRPVIFRNNDLSLVESFNIILNEMFEDNKINELLLKKINNSLIEILRKKEFVYSNIYSIKE